MRLSLLTQRYAQRDFIKVRSSDVSLTLTACFSALTFSSTRHCSYFPLGIGA